MDFDNERDPTFWFGFKLFQDFQLNGLEVSVRKIKVNLISNENTATLTVNLAV